MQLLNLITIIVRKLFLERENHWFTSKMDNIIYKMITLLCPEASRGQFILIILMEFSGS